MKYDDVQTSFPQASVYVTFGADVFKKWQIRRKIEKSFLLPKVVVFSDDQNLFDKAECCGLLPEAKLVIVEDFSEVQNKKTFCELIERACEGSVFLLQCAKKEKVATSKAVVEIECFDEKLNEKEFIQIVKGWLKGSAFTLNDIAIKKIFNLTSGDLFYAFNEIQKIAVYAHATNSAHVSLEELKTLTGPRFDSDPFAFSNFYLQKNAKLALAELQSWKTADVMFQLHNQFKAIERALVALACKKTVKVEKITQETGIPFWYLKYTLPEIESKWSDKELIDALRDCTVAIHKAKKVVNLAIPVMMESVLRRCKFGGSVE